MQPSDFRGIETEAKKADFWLKDVSGDLQMAGSILTKSLIALDRLAQVVGKPVVEREVALLNGALAMLGNANHHTKLARRFIMTREIHKKYSHLCLDKLPMTRFLFGDDVSQSARKIEGTDRLWNNFSTKAAPVAWSSPVGALGRSGGGPPAEDLLTGSSPTRHSARTTGVVSGTLLHVLSRTQKTPGAGVFLGPGNKVNPFQLVGSVTMFMCGERLRMIL